MVGCSVDHVCGPAAYQADLQCKVEAFDRDGLNDWEADMVSHTCHISVVGCST